MREEWRAYVVDVLGLFRKFFLEVASRLVEQDIIGSLGYDRPVFDDVHRVVHFFDLDVHLTQCAVKYPDRILIGTDKVGHWETYPDEVFKYYKLLDSLEPEVAEKICRNNALSLIKKH